MIYNSVEAFKIWAPDDALWTDWAKPVLFANTPTNFNDFYQMKIPKLRWSFAVDAKTMVVVDLPGPRSIDAGLALAEQNGMRPVPLFNGVSCFAESAQVIKVADMVACLFQGAEHLQSVVLRSDARPAFLLDSRRMEGLGADPGKFDNRWMLFPQDMPSAAFVKNEGIDRVLVRTKTLLADLEHVLLQYQKQGIAVYLCADDEKVREEKISRTGWPVGWFYRAKVLFRFRRNAAGGFGATVPVPNEGSGRHYGRYG